MSILWFGLGRHVEKFHPQHSFLSCFVLFSACGETNLRLEVVANMVEQFL